MEIDIIRRKGSRGPRPAYPFGLEFLRGNTPEIHEFRSYPVLDAGSLSYTLSATKHNERAIEGMVRSILKMLADDDGTPFGYTPVAYRAPEQGEPQDDADEKESPELDEDESDEERLFVGPDGEPHDGEFIRQALEFKAGSSKRRFAYLMDEDNELTLEVEQLEQAWKKLVGKASDRPTRR